MGQQTASRFAIDEKNALITLQAILTLRGVVPEEKFRRLSYFLNRLPPYRALPLYGTMMNAIGNRMEEDSPYRDGLKKVGQAITEHIGTDFAHEVEQDTGLFEPQRKVLGENLEKITTLMDHIGAQTGENVCSILSARCAVHAKMNAGMSFMHQKTFYQMRSIGPMPEEVAVVDARLTQQHLLMDFADNRNEAVYGVKNYKIVPVLSDMPEISPQFYRVYKNEGKTICKPDAEVQQTFFNGNGGMMTVWTNPNPPQKPAISQPVATIDLHGNVLPFRPRTHKMAS